MQPENLARMQERFWKLMTAPSGVAEAIRALAGEDPKISPVRAWVAQPSDEQAIERLDVYANMYFYRLIDILREDYPKVVATVGDANFHNLITDYLLEHPSTNASVRHVGSRLPAFLNGHALSNQYPFAADLARLELARTDVFDVEDPRAVSGESLNDLSPDLWPDLRFRLISALKVLELSYPVHQIWAAVHDNREAPLMEAVPTHLVVWRRAFRVYHRPVQSDESQAIKIIEQDEPFSILCERLARSEEVPADAAKRVFDLLNRWFEDELVQAVGCPPQSVSERTLDQ